MRGTALLYLIPAALLLSPLQAAAASKQTGKEPAKQASKQVQEREAKKACLAGDPARGVEVLAELYVDTNDITYIFNQGRCFEQNRRYEDAIGRFREYLTKGEDHLSGDEKAAAKKHIDTCASYLPKSEPRSPLTPEPASATPIVQTPPSAEVAPEPPAAVVATEAQQPDKNAGSGLRIAGIVVGTLGLAAIGTGVALNLKVNSMSTDLEKPNNFNRDTESSRKTYKTMGWIGYGAGGAFLAGGSLLYFLGWQANHSSAQPSVAFLPTLAPGSAGALLTGAF